MLYLGIVQHPCQIKISLRDEKGEVLRAEQISTHPVRINTFFQHLTSELLKQSETFVALLEVCDFNGWLIRILEDYQCQQVVLIHREEEKKSYTFRRDAVALSELLWGFRDLLLSGKRVYALCPARIVSFAEQENQQLSKLRKESMRSRTDVVNKIMHLLHRLNLQWEMPTSSFPSKSAICWLEGLELSEIDRLELNHLLLDLEHYQLRIKTIEGVTANKEVQHQSDPNSCTGSA